MSLITDKQVRQFRELGYFLTDVVFEPSELKAMAGDMDRIHRENVERVRRESGNDPQAMRRVDMQRSYSQVHLISEAAAAFVKAPIYLDACRTFLGPDADLYYNQYTPKLPMTGRTFKWHQDSGYVRTRPVEYITCWTAVSDSNLDNGCIWIIPGSHKWGLLRHEPEAETDEHYGGLTAQFSDDSGKVPVEMKAGQVAIFSSLMLHMSGPNRSRISTRQGYVPQYHSPTLIEETSGKIWGDQFPVLRHGCVV